MQKYNRLGKERKPKENRNRTQVKPNAEEYKWNRIEWNRNETNEEGEPKMNTNCETKREEDIRELNIVTYLIYANHAMLGQAISRQWQEAKVKQELKRYETERANRPPRN